MKASYLATDVDFGLAYLQTALARLDVLLHRQLQRFAQAHVQSSDNAQLDRYFVSEAQAFSVLYQRVGHNTPELSTSEAEEYAQALDNLDRQLAGMVEAAAAAGVSIPFLDLVSTFSLAPLEQDILLASLAPELDSRYGKLYGYLNNDPALEFATIDLLIDLIAPPGLGRLSLLRFVSHEGGLAQRHLLDFVAPAATASRLRATARPDPALVSWLFGTYRAPELLRDHLRLQSEPETHLWLLPPALQHAIADAAASADNLVVLHGRERLAQESAVGLIAALSDRPVLTLNLETVARADVPLRWAIEMTLRDARLTKAIPHFLAWETVVEGKALTSTLVEMLLDYPGIVIFSGALRWQPNRVSRDRRVHTIDFPVAGGVDRKFYLERFLQDSGRTPDTVGDLTTIAGQFMLTSEQWRDVVYQASDSAVQAHAPLAQDHLFAAARAQSSPGLIDLAHKIETRFDWDDLILPAEPLAILHEIVATVRQRAFVLEEWGLGKSLVSSPGVAILFSGPPGTGKTMAASVLARQLGLDLYKIDLSGVVSKYIGETEKNLEKIFAEAEDSNAILFFDEADAIFGKRSDVSDAHDRHANIEVSYLLQRMETYSGVTILATNLRGNLDEAFFRRLQFAVDLPFPDVADRVRIWRSLFPSEVPASPDVDLELMARRFKMAGGNIRNVLVNATYTAAADGRVITMAHLLHGARRELQKMGRMLNEKDFQ